MSKLKSLLLIQIITFSSVRAQNYANETNRGYYCRDFKYPIYEDAVPSDSEQQSYVGQAYVHGSGTFVVQIFPDNKNVFAATPHRQKGAAIKILCSNEKNKLRWLRTSADYFHQNLTLENPVIGGFSYAPRKGMLHVGRLIHNQVTRVGSIQGSSSTPEIVFVWGTSPGKSIDYEVLVFDND